jgi:hypothetical protein
MPSIREILDRPFVKEDAIHHAGISMGKMLQWQSMLHLGSEQKRASGRGRPRQLFGLTQIITLAVCNSLTQDLTINRSSAASMVKSILDADLTDVLRQMQEYGHDLQYMRLAALRRFIKSLEVKNPKGHRNIEKGLRDKMQETRFKVRDELQIKLGQITPDTSYWMVFLSGPKGSWSMRVYIETGEPTTSEQNFFFSIAASSRFFLAINLGEIVGEVCRSIFAEIVGSYSEMLDEIIGEELLDRLLLEG